MRYLIAALLFAMACSAQAQNATITCSTIGGTVTCDSRTQDPNQGQIPPIQQMDIGKALQAYEAGKRASANREAPQEAMPNDDVPLTTPEEMKSYTGREMYISCYLFTKQALVESNQSNARANPFVCGEWAISYLTHREGAVAPDNVKDVSDLIRFCLPQKAEIRDNPTRAMAYAYMDYFDENAAKASFMTGYNVLLLSAFKKWPCPDPS